MLLLKQYIFESIEEYEELEKARKQVIELFKRFITKFGDDFHERNNIVLYTVGWNKFKIDMFDREKLFLDYYGFAMMYWSSQLGNTVITFHNNVISDYKHAISINNFETALNIAETFEEFAELVKQFSVKQLF